MQYFLLKVVTSCDLDFVYGNHEPYIYNCLLEAQEDIIDNGKEGTVEVYLQPNGEIKTDFYGWKFVKRVIAISGFCEEKYKN